MFKTSIARLSTRSQTITLAKRMYADAPAGSVAASKDAFGKREKAQEDKYMRDREREKQERLKKHIKDQRSALDELEKSMEDKH
ncbi:hypothetical protein BCR37DRAFT_383965 [Protomyces lactucae-debilis]|uniref:ATPase inhibitor, mitochondrial n=1 Tax=Protomyces lactucae-debilis TaxID=2754530 RepID=A0A1Y2EWD2_PROLT|nr:uncharacterized protein BCR37DRAFT_383965 [Protomyces lactucae-debilis]ORY75807.1 hypothetical protein BCR37DRAFT_383965 [Protomyces lactucae-debilis]